VTIAGIPDRGVRGPRYVGDVAGPEELGVPAERVAALREAAQEARTATYSPYSGLMILAAVETPVGVFGGSNVENANFSLTKHAEEVAILAAIHAGAGPEGEWLRTLYVTGASPCGSCRQFAAEFGSPETLVLIDRLHSDVVRGGSLADLDEGGIEAWRLGALLPDAFGPTDLDGGTT
jgi:cytidine deaminase